MAGADSTVVALRDAAKAAVDVEDFLYGAEGLLVEDLGLNSMWVALPAGPQRLAIQPRSFDPLVPGLSGTIGRTEHPALLALTTASPQWVQGRAAVHLAAGSDAAAWNQEFSAMSLWAVPSSTLVLVGVSDRDDVLSTSNRVRLTTVANLAAVLHSDPRRPSRQRALHSLTGRQQLIAHFIARGMTNAQIAAELDVSAATVAADASAAIHALGHGTRTELATELATDRLLDEVG